MSMTRIEHDLLGDRAGARRRLLRRAHAAGAGELPDHGHADLASIPDLVRALACVKQAAALANHELGAARRRASATRSSRPARRSARARCTTSSSST